ncbi:MAG: hypothetical protein ACOYJE_02935 [Bacteroidaceae bacterium]|jgi:hypothetical protein
MMKKKSILLATLLAACCVPVASVQAQVDGEDYTSHIVNAGFEEGPDLNSPFPVTGNYGTFYAPVGWTVTYNAQSLEWGSQHFKYEVYSADNVGANGMSSEDGNVAVLLYPTEGEGFYQQGFMAWNATAHHDGGPIIILEQTVNDLPAGTYTLTADGCVLEQDENGWFIANGYNFYGKVENDAIGHAAQVEFPHYMHESIANPAGTPTVEPQLTTMSIDFVVTEDNQPVTISFDYSYPGSSAYPQQIYLDNITLTRTGDRDNIVNSINDETMLTYVPFLTESFNNLGFDYAPEGWEDLYDEYSYGIPDGIETMEDAMEWQNAVINLTAQIDSLLDLRASLQLDIDSAISAETLQYAGLADLTALREQAQATLEKNMPGATIAEVSSMIEALEAEFIDYTFSGVSSATAENPIDMNFMVQNPAVDGTTGLQTSDCAPGWVISVTAGGSQAYLGTGNTYEDGTANSTSYFNAWDATAGLVDYTAKQTITGLPQGVYRLTAELSGDGAGISMFAQASGVYYATEADGSGSFKTYTVDNILVLDGNLTIGATTQGDELWGGTAFAGSWFSADNFHLYLTDDDVTSVTDVLVESIAEAEATIEANRAASLLGDVAAAEAVLEEARPLVDTDPVDVEGIAAILPEVKNINSNIATSAEAYGSISALVSEASLCLESDSSTAESLQNLQAVLNEVAVYLESETAVAAEADSVISILNAAINATYVHSVPQDVTFLIVNPDQNEGTNGYIMESTSVDWQGVTGSSDYYGVPCNHFCYWQSSVKEEAAFNWYQTIAGIPDGYYKLTVNGLYAAGNLGDGSDVPNENVVFYAYGDSRYEEQVPFTVYTIGMGGELTASDSLLKDSRTLVYTLDSVVVNDGNLTFGVKNIGFINATTVRWYGFRLTYLGGADEVPPTVGIISTEMPEQNIVVYAKNGQIVVEGADDYMIYTINGVAVDKYSTLMPGIYIVRAGTKAVKVVVD